MEAIFKNPIIEKVDYPLWSEKGLAISVLREDLVHPFINGNKWRKLKYNIIDFKASGKKTLLTFGGVFSNHLVATASASKEYGFHAVCIVRGENVDNPYLNFIRSNGIPLQFISRNDYRKKSDEKFISDLLIELYEKNLIGSPESVFILPEGGSNTAAVKGAGEIMDEVPVDCEFIACACGTGATLAGISKKLLPHQYAIGIAVLKADGYLEREIKRLGGNTDQVILKSDYHCGGYAKTNRELLDFCKDFTTQTKIPLEPVYTGKLFFALNDMIKNDYLKRGTKVTLIHTGGIFNF